MQRLVTVGGSRAVVRAGLLALAVIWLATSAGMPPLARAAEPCPNAMRRANLRSTRLPDCRAYELVTPPYKAGTFVASLNAISPDGNRAVGQSLGSFAGNENDQFGPGVQNFGATYEFARTPSGWTTTSLNPPASVYPQSGLLGMSADLNRSLWELGEVATPSEPAARAVISFYRREADGTFVRVGPMSAVGVQNVLANRATVVYDGASADLSHIVFRVEAGGEPSRTWPGDNTAAGAHSLYEYARTGTAEPTLVGVKNEGPLTGSPHLNEDAELVSECGTSLGGSESSAYNAVSADGAIVYFTAAACGGGPAVNELYARVGGSKTVPISEPNSAECTGECAAAPKREGIFAGASQDGSKVFFLSEQPLLNTDHDETADLYEAELVGGHLRNIADLSHGGPGDPSPGEHAIVEGVSRISADGTHVYFVAEGVLTDRENAQHETAAAGSSNLYVFTKDAQTADEGAPEGRVSFVATLSGEDSADWQRADIRPVETTQNGEYFVFPSAAHLTGTEDTSTVSQLFEYHARGGSLKRVSIGENGYNDNGNTENPEQAPAIRAPIYLEEDFPAEATSSLSLAETGAVFFTSADSLAPAATSGMPNVYEYRDGSVNLISDGQDTSLVDGESAVRLLGVDVSGADVFFSTVDPVLLQDSDTQQDFYDARDGGGVAPVAAPVACAGDACQGRVAVGAPLPTPGTTTQAGGGNRSGPAASTSRPTPKKKVVHKKKKKKRKQKAKSGAADGPGRATSRRSASRATRDRAKQPVSTQATAR